LALLAIVIALPLWAILARHFAPLSNTSRAQFDAIIVLGTPADSDGNPTPELQDRITEGVREYERGIAPRLIVTGGPAHNRFVEADVMARVAEAQGVPASRVIEEPQASNTIENACFSARILKTHDWHSVEVVSSASHLPRAAYIFSHLPIQNFEWRMHPAQGDLTPGYVSNVAPAAEILKTARYLVWARWTDTCTP
jgi:uncharacterized SAM-binding protein YcdF (DUF218 family)